LPSKRNLQRYNEVKADMEALGLAGVVPGAVVTCVGGGGLLAVGLYKVASCLFTHGLKSACFQPLSL
jgi:hypothetical protein